MEPPAAKKRRYAKACDACYRRKVKCHWEPPSCPACVKAGNACVFTRAERSDPKPRRSTQGLEAVYDRLKVVEGLLQGLRKEESSRGSGLAAIDPDVSVSNRQVQTTAPGLSLQAIDSVEEIIRFYFKETNHYFPIFDHAAFLRSMQDRNADAESDSVWWASLNIVMSLCHFSNDWSGDFGTGQGKTTAEACLQNAMAVAGKIMLLDPTVSGIQALVSIASGLLHSHVDGARTRASVLVAAAVRMANSLHLHQLDVVNKINAADRLEMIRAFWCLYILDKEHSLFTSQPWLIDDEDVFVLEPKMVSDDGIGLIVSGDGTSVLNLFTARQRLARIASRLYKGLYTFNGRHQPSSRREDLKTLINGQLADWKREYFNCGEAEGMLDRWPKPAGLHIFALHFTYLECVIKANPEVPSDTESAQHLMQKLRSTDHNHGAATEVSNCPAICVQAARDVLIHGQTVRDRTSRQISRVISRVIPALMILIWHLSSPEHPKISDGECALIQDWMSSMAILCDRDGHDDLKAAYHVCSEMRGLRSAI